METKLLDYDELLSICMSATRANFRQRRCRYDSKLWVELEKEEQIHRSQFEGIISTASIYLGRHIWVSSDFHNLCVGIICKERVSESSPKYPVYQGLVTEHEQKVKETLKIANEGLQAIITEGSKP